MTSAAQRLFQRAIASLQTGALQDAERALAELLRHNPSHLGALNLLGIVLTQLARYGEAEDVIRRAIALDARSDATFHNFGLVLKALGRPGEAYEAFNKAIAIDPSVAANWNNRGTVLNDLGRYGEAISDFQRAIALDARYAEAYYNMGRSRAELGEHADAIAAYDAALKLHPGFAEAQCNRGVALHMLKRYEEALDSHARALAARPNYAEALSNRGNTLRELGRKAEALDSYKAALAADPSDADASYNCGVLLAELEAYDEALAAYERALALQPNHADALQSRGVLLFMLGRHDEALESLDKAFRIKPKNKFLAGQRLHCRMFVCDWSDFDDECARLVAAVRAGRPALSPFEMLTIPCSGEDQLACARIYVAERVPRSLAPLWRGDRYAHDRIRLAYVSADLHEHPVARLVAGLFERHDRRQFETIAISLGPDDRSDLRARLRNAFDRFIDMRGKSDGEVARAIRDLEADIAVDLMGHTVNSRPAVFAARPAPIQASYLGYAGTLGGNHVDYVIADRIVIPAEHRHHYSERPAYLPDSYLCSDSQRRISNDTPTRAGAGLPETGFVFCAFNNTYKLTPRIFDIWMRLLRAVEGSVLWLSRPHETAVRNLRREAQERGVDAARLIFAPRVERVEDHLARHRLAGLFLDTLPYNAHATASDALWAGLPVVTCAGETFAGRVAASLLSAAGLPELATKDLAEYEALALALARDPAALAEVRGRLARNRETCPLFDTARFTRHIEAAYRTMWEIWQQGGSPCSFSVRASPRPQPGAGQ